MLNRPEPLHLLFIALAAVHLASLLGGSIDGADTVQHITKPALMPALALYTLACGGPRLLVAALLFGCGGDTLLEIGGDLVFLLGMGCFAAGHICYITFFLRNRRRIPPLLAAGYAAAWLGLVIALWSGLPAGMRGPVAVYSLLLTAMALGALSAGPVALAGGALFLLSDSLIATDIADWPQAPQGPFWVMLTYIAAQYALAHGVVRTHLAGAAAPAPAPEGAPAAG
ncbi:lysoplasmalogenase [Streptomyces palmae]|uniref:Lysoplasmalogenase n=1 Tax=Streptomyces palmae TaxID=1701085 RepID=A0A4Z0HEP9_9ACTN|nr:lysoplasmalogenase [Streptomyces palmae]